MIMLISVEFEQLKDVQEHLKKELDVLERLRNALEFQYELSQVSPDENAELFRKQLEFINKEKEKVLERKKLLQNTLETFVEAKYRFREEINSAKYLLDK